MIKKYKYEIAIALVILMGIVATWVLTANAAPVRYEDKVFDHSQCQYPERTTNPPNGCDNTDPANPACAVKGLPEDCTEGLEQPKPTPKPKPKPQPKPAPGCYN